MTTDEFNTRYKLLKQIAHGKGRSFTAQECASERAVLVHFLTEDGTASGSAVSELIERLAPRDRSKILEILAVNLSTVVVTQFLEDFQGFDAWLQKRLADPSAPAPGPAAQPIPSAGDFTSLFESPVGPASAPGPQAPGPPAAAQEGSRGGFTELFRPPPESKARPHPIPAPATPPVEMLRVRVPPSDPAPPRPAAPPLPSWPSSFEAPKAPLSPLPLHHPPLPSPVLPSPMLRPRGAGEPIVTPPHPDVLPPPAPLPGWSGESDYTRQLRAVPVPADPNPPPPAPAPAPEPTGGGTRSLVPLLLVLNIVAIIATGLIVYFALKR